MQILFCWPRRSTRACLYSLHEFAALMYSVVVVGALGICDHHAEGLAVLEAGIGLTREDYRNPQQLLQKVEAHFRNTPAELSMIYMSMLNGALGVVHRDFEVRALVKAELGIVETAVDPQQMVCPHARALLDADPRNGRFSIFFTWV
jgi:hypothetical protein